MYFKHWSLYSFDTTFCFKRLTVFPCNGLLYFVSCMAWQVQYNLLVRNYPWLECHCQLTSIVEQCVLVCTLGKKSSIEEFFNPCDSSWKITRNFSAHFWSIALGSCASNNDKVIFQVQNKSILIFKYSHYYRTSKQDSVFFLFLSLWWLWLYQLEIEVVNLEIDRNNMFA